MIKASQTCVSPVSDLGLQYYPQKEKKQSLHLSLKIMILNLNIVTSFFFFLYVDFNFPYFLWPSLWCPLKLHVVWTESSDIVDSVIKIPSCEFLLQMCKQIAT